MAGALAMIIMSNAFRDAVNRNVWFILYL